MVRAKMKLTEINQHAHSTNQKLTIQAEYDTSIPEDQKFSKATPSAKFEIYVDNPAALEQLKLGQTYYFDISPA